MDACVATQHNFLCLHSEQRRRIDFWIAALSKASGHNYRSCLRKWYRIGTWVQVGLWRYGIFSYRGEAATNIAVWRLIARTPKSLPPPSCQKSLMTFDQERMQLRLVVIDGVGGDTGVKSQHRLRHLPTAAPSPTMVFFFFFFFL